MIASCTVARGHEEICHTPSPSEVVDITLMLKRQRSTSQSDSGFDGLLSPLDEEPMSLDTNSASPIHSPGYYHRPRVRYCSESESSLTSNQVCAYVHLWSRNGSSVIFYGHGQDFAPQILDEKH